MECPKCYGAMDTVLDEETKVERCKNCYGLYFDQLSQELLPGLIGKEEIDSGNDEVGSAYDEMVYVDCPKCDQIMDQRKLEEPLSIRFEFCPTCNASFLDAGELREYLSTEYLEEFKSLLPVN